ncbi:hypothetical protein P5706_21390 [Pseudomonas sp. ChxA]|uniref:hypothetical protein n=1 Tax=Pseudomonas sp. ChxA TaxID=3035473 RepID=UPI00255326ED|nr:hypothetical protein [Pseudomonas sp. ChxA]MDL2186748.1 hypothetical protein [Pseudomonas sp. ChxA]
MSKDNSEPAFPAPEASMEHYGKADGYTGMSLRDYFAAKAMQGFSASPSMIDSNDSRAIAYVAAASYAMADAMLAARSA